jgi:hypothetical protein
MASLRRRFPHTRAEWGRAAASVVGWGIILGMIGFVVGPAFRDMKALGSHDWDQMESHRYLVQKTIRQYGQFPFWNPYGCGGTPSWAGLESGSTIVSPWFPFYLFASLPVALKVELAGTALISAIGTWLFAGRFTKSAALRAFCCVVFVVNGRWALQAAVGHTWHLYYAWTPWVFYFFDRATGLGDRSGGSPPRWRDVVLCSASIAMIAYNGGIYPLPQTILALGVWSIALAAFHRSFAPVVLAMCAGVVSFGLAAPKLIPTVDMLRRFPRLIDSTETLDLHTFVVTLTARNQTLTSGPANVYPYGWHEWGIYIGWVSFVALLAGAVFARGPRETPLKWVGLLLVVLGFGAFHEHAPWTVLHHLPIFKSQHVPSRWLYPALLLLAVVFVSMFDRLLRGWRRARPLAELALLVLVGWLAQDVARVASIPFAQAFDSHMPKTVVETRAFRTETHVLPENYYSGSSYGPPSLTSEMANIDTIECMLFPGLSVFAKDSRGVIVGLGATGKGDPAYRGEAYLANGKGKATLASFTPNVMTVRVENATPGDLAVLNQNWDDGWRANGKPAVAFHDSAATVIDSPTETIVFSYRPRSWWLSLGVFATTIGAIAAAYARRRRPGLIPRWFRGPVPD